MNIPVLAWPFIAAFWIFVLWMLWLVAKSVKGLDKSVKEMTHALESKS